MKSKAVKPETKKSEYNLSCIYAGRRLFGDGKVRQLFLCGDKEWYFKGVKGVWVGFTYKCGEGRIASKPERMDAELINNPEWEAADKLVDAHNAKKRGEAKLKAKVSPAIKNAIHALVPLVRRLGYYETRTLVEFLANEAKKKSK
jgi:hypothetical protein